MSNIITSVSLFSSTIITLILYQKYLNNKENKKENKENNNEIFIEPLELPIINLDLINQRNINIELFNNECHRIAEGFLYLFCLFICCFYLFINSLTLSLFVSFFLSFFFHSSYYLFIY